MTLVQVSSIWNFMGIAANVASLHYAMCQSVNVFLADFMIVLNAIHVNKYDFNQEIKHVSVRKRKETRIEAKEYLIEAIDVHMTSTK